MMKIQEAIHYMQCQYEEHSRNGRHHIPKAYKLALDALPLLQKQQDGLLIELPVSLGTPVYVIVDDEENVKVGNPFPHKVEEWRFSLELLSSWGSWVFATRNEAEKALEEKDEQEDS